MKIREYLEYYYETGQYDKVESICQNIRGVGIKFSKKLSSNYVIKKLEDRLHNKDNALIDKVLKHLEEGVIEELQRIVFSGEINQNPNTVILNEWGFLYDNELPEDIRSTLLNIWKDKLLNEFINYPKPYNPSFFLLYILMLSVINKGVYGKDKIKEKINLNTDDFNRFILYGKEAGHLFEEENNLKGNKDNINAWLKKDKLNVLHEFYNWFIDELSYTNVGYIVHQISELQTKENQWLSYNDLMKILEPKQISNVENLGLIVFMSKNNEEYIQLSSEGWFMTKESGPMSWEKQESVICDENRKYIVYNYDPFAISKIYQNSILEVNEYILVFKE